MTPTTTTAAPTARDVTHYPVSLDLDGRLVLVVGGGCVAVRRAGGAIAAGARVRLVAPSLCGAGRRLLAEHPDRMRWIAQPYREGHLDGMADERVWFVHTATGVSGVDDAVATDAAARGVWCVRADDARRSAAWTPAVGRGEPGGGAEGITVAVTAGGDPRRAVAVRDAVLDLLRTGALPTARHRLTRAQ